MLQKTYSWVMDKAAHRHAVWWLAAIAFIESSIFPIPPDVMLVPMILAAPTRWFRIAVICTLASVIGGFFGYAIGYFFFETLGQGILEFYNAVEKFQSFQAIFNEWGAIIVAVAGFTPFPYKVITIFSGVTHLDLATFTSASIVSRGGRFLLVAALLWKFGPPIRVFIERRLGLLTIVFTVLLVAGFAALKLL